MFILPQLLQGKGFATQHWNDPLPILTLNVDGPSALIPLGGSIIVLCQQSQGRIERSHCPEPGFANKRVRKRKGSLCVLLGEFKCLLAHCRLCISLEKNELGDRIPKWHTRLLTGAVGHEGIIGLSYFEQHIGIVESRRGPQLDIVGWVQEGPGYCVGIARSVEPTPTGVTFIPLLSDPTERQVCSTEA